MKAFISWSGARSKVLAEILHEWLPNVIQAVEPWMSASNIDKGVRWSSDIAQQLEETQFGILCLTVENLEAPWILFEAGALSKTLEKTFLCPYLLDIEPTDLKGPLVQFQATKAQKEDTRKLVQTINSAVSGAALVDSKLNKAFDLWWPELEEKLQAIPSSPKSELGFQRNEREILEEILELVRSQTRQAAEWVQTPSQNITYDYGNLSPSQTKVLLVLAKEQRALSISEISKRVNINTTLISNALQSLINRNLVIEVVTEQEVKFAVL